MGNWSFAKKLCVFLVVAFYYSLFHAQRRMWGISKSTMTMQHLNDPKFLPTLDMLYLLLDALLVILLGSVGNSNPAKPRRRQRLMFTFAILQAFFSVAMGLSAVVSALHQPPYVYFCRIANGLSSALAWVVTISYLRDTCLGTSTRFSGLVFGLLTMTIQGGNVVGGIIGSASLERLGGWQWSYFIVASMIAVYSPAVLFLPNAPDHIPPVAQISEETSRYHEIRLLFSRIAKVLRVPGVIWYALANVFIKGVMMSLLVSLPLYLNDELGFDPSLASTISIYLDIGGAAGCLAAGLLSDVSTRYHVGRSVVLLPMVLLGGVMFLILNLYEPLTLQALIGALIGAGILLGGAYGLLAGAVSADLGSDPSLENCRAVATAGGLVTGAGSIGGAITIQMIGIIVEHTSWRGYIYTLVGLIGFSSFLIAPLCVRAIVKCRKRKEPYKMLVNIQE